MARGGARKFQPFLGLGGLHQGWAASLFLIVLKRHGLNNPLGVPFKAARVFWEEHSLPYAPFPRPTRWTTWAPRLWWMPRRRTRWDTENLRSWAWVNPQTAMWACLFLRTPFFVEGKQKGQPLRHFGGAPSKTRHMFVLVLGFGDDSKPHATPNLGRCINMNRIRAHDLRFTLRMFFLIVPLHQQVCPLLAPPVSGRTFPKPWRSKRQLPPAVHKSPCAL